MKIRETRDTNDPGWLELRFEFIPEVSLEKQRLFLRRFAQNSVDFCAFIACDQDNKPVGFAEVSVRADYVNGCKYRPALFLEGIFVRPQYRGQGIARAICAAAERWGSSNGCREFASDVEIDDIDSQAAHTGLGFEETERVIYYRKELAARKDTGGSR